MPTAKDHRFNMALSAEDKAMIGALSSVDDISEAQVMRQLLRRAYAERFGEKKPKPRKV